jgi:hypothetical protein
MLPPLSLPPLPRYRSHHQAAAAVPPPSFQRCRHRCHAIAMLSLPLLPLLPHCRCRRQAAATKLPQLLLPSCCCHGATTKLPATVTTTVMHAEIKNYTYVGIHNEYTLASTVIGTIRHYKT